MLENKFSVIQREEEVLIIRLLNLAQCLHKEILDTLYFTTDIENVFTL